MTPMQSETTQGARAREICARYDNRRDGLIEILHDVQDFYGFVPREALADIADALNITRAEVYGVVTFYHDFRESPRARHLIEFCRAEACQAVGCRALENYLKKKLGIEFGGQTSDGMVALKETFCLGDCALGPAALIDGKLYGRLDEARLDAILSAFAKEGV